MGLLTEVDQEGTAGGSEPTAAPGRSGTLRAAGFVGALLFFAVLIPLSLADVGASQASGVVTLVALLLAGYVAAEFCRAIVWRHAIDLFDSFFWLFVYVFAAVPALAQVTRDEYPLPLPRDHTQHQLLVALLVVFAATVGYRIGRALARRRSSGALAPGRVPRRVSSTRLVLMMLIATPVALWLVGRIGIAPFFSSRAAAARQLAGDSQGVRLFQAVDTYLSATLRVVRVMVFVPMYLVIWHHRRGERVIKSPSHVFFLAGPALVFFIILANPLSNSRFWMGVVLFSLAVAILGQREVLYRGRLMAALAITLLLTFPYLDYFRYDERLTRSGGPKDLIVTSGSFSVFQMTLNGVTYVAQNGYQYGQQVLTAALFWMPRSWTSLKGTDTGKLVGGEIALNWASPLWVEFLVDFGPIGVIVGFSVVGALFARLDAPLRRAHRDMSAMAPLLACSSLLVFRGSLLTSITIIVVLGLALRAAYPRTRFEPPGSADRDGIGSGRVGKPGAEASRPGPGGGPAE